MKTIASLGQDDVVTDPVSAGRTTVPRARARETKQVSNRVTLADCVFKFDFSVENLKRGISNPYQVFDEILLQHGYRIPSIMYNVKFGIGTNIFSNEWDMLIILDTCRVDALQEVADEYDFIETVESLKTVGGSTPEWTARTFAPEYRESIKETAYLTATAQTRSILEESIPASRSLKDSHLAYKLLQYFDTVDIEELGHVEYLFNFESKGDDGPYGHREGFTPPRYITDRAISVSREHTYDRLILHYIQPHPPYVARALAEERELHDFERSPLRYLRDTGDFEKIWDAYLDELRYVLDDVEIVLTNVDADTVVITADHGEAFGEFGIYGHTIGSLHPKVRNVPWTITSAQDTRSYEPEIELPKEREHSVDESTEEILRAMGYKI